MLDVMMLIKLETAVKMRGG